MGENSKVLGGATKRSFFQQLSTFNFQLYLLIDKEKIQNGRFPQISIG